jgi:hypothetical protein
LAPPIQTSASNKTHNLLESLRKPYRWRHNKSSDIHQNHTILKGSNLKGGETFGAEFLVIAKKKGLTIGELKCDPPQRRKNLRIGGKIKANLRITWALIKSLTLYLI